MQFTITRGALLSALQTVSRAVATRSTLPILGNVLLSANDDCVGLVATDLEIGLRTSADAGVSAPGEVAVPAKMLQEIVSNLAEGEITVSADDNHVVTVRAGKAKYAIHGLPAEEFPTVPTVESENRLTIDAATLRFLVRRTLFAASTDDGRVLLTGALLVIDSGKLLAAATDTYRLSVQEYLMPALPARPAPLSTIIPARGWSEANTLCRGVDGTVEIIIADNQVSFTVGRSTLVSRIIEGQFPAYERVIPDVTEHSKVLTICREALLDAVKRASIVARAESNKLRFTTADSVLTIDAATGEVGQAHEEVDCQYTGDPVEIAFNAEYFVDALSALDCAQVRLTLTGPLNPGLLTADSEAGFQHVIMPMQIL